MSSINSRSQLITEIVDLLTLPHGSRDRRIIACELMSNSEFFNDLFIEVTGERLLDGFITACMDMPNLESGAYSKALRVGYGKPRYKKIEENLEALSNIEVLRKKINLVREKSTGVLNLSITGKNTAYYENEEDYYYYTPTYTTTEVSSEINPHFDRPHECYTDYFISVND